MGGLEDIEPTYSTPLYGQECHPFSPLPPPLPPPWKQKYFSSPFLRFPTGSKKKEFRIRKGKVCQVIDTVFDLTRWNTCLFLCLMSKLVSHFRSLSYLSPFFSCGFCCFTISGREKKKVHIWGGQLDSFKLPGMSLTRRMSSLFFIFIFCAAAKEEREQHREEE